MTVNINIIYVLIFLIIFFLILDFYKKNFNKLEENKLEENKLEENNFEEINFYTISLKKRERLENIEKQNKKLKTKIKIIDAINGINIEQNKLLEENILSKNFVDNNLKRNKEIGCYLSHKKIYEIIKENKENKKYSIIFEDDFNIISENIIEELKNIIILINELEFDILFLGNTFDNIGTQIKNNIYSINKEKYTIGNFGYLINNKNINKLIDLIKVIDSPIDNKIDTLIKNNKLNCIVIYPNIINYVSEIKSDIL